MRPAATAVGSAGVEKSRRTAGMRGGEEKRGKRKRGNSRRGPGACSARPLPRGALARFVRARHWVV